MEFEFVRWFNEDDYLKLSNVISYNKKQNNPDQQLQWLQKNCDLIKKLHADYYDNQVEKKNIEIQQRKGHNDVIDGIKNGNYYSCVCGSYLVHRGEFAGCKDFRNPVQHTCLNYKKIYYEVKIEKEYLSHIAKIIKNKYNKDIRAGNLYEFLVLNKITILNKDINRNQFKGLKESAELSKKRELMVKTILEENKIRFGYQRHIKYKLIDCKEKHAIPDFIVKHKNEFYIIEQKKSTDNVYEDQVELYQSLIRFMRPDDKINIIFVVEEHKMYDDFKYPVLNINEFKQYISCL